MWGINAWLLYKVGYISILSLLVGAPKWVSDLWVSDLWVSDLCLWSNNNMGLIFEDQHFKLSCDVVGEYMLRDGSDSEDSFSGDDDPPPSERDTTTSELIPTSQASVSITGDTPPDSAPGEETKGETADQEGITDKEGEETQAGESADAPEDKGDPEMAPIYLKKMLPIFTELFHSSLAPPLRWVHVGTCSTLHIVLANINTHLGQCIVLC